MITGISAFFSFGDDFEQRAEEVFQYLEAHVPTGASDVRRIGPGIRLGEGCASLTWGCERGT